MPQTKPVTTPGQSSIIVLIEDVDLANRSVHAFDKTRGKIQVSFRNIPGGGLLRIPTQGERWTAERQGWVWRLTGRISSRDEQDALVALLAPGDSELSTPGSLYVDAQEIILNGLPVLGSRRTILNIEDFGAINADDDTHAVTNSIAIQKALDTAAGFDPGGGIVYIPPGVYRIHDAIIPRDAVTVIGSGVNSQIQIAAGRNIDAFDSGPNGGLNSATFRSFSVSCNMDENPDHGLANYTGCAFVGSYTFCTWDQMEVKDCAFRGWDLAWPYRGDGWTVYSGFQNNIRHSTCASVYECIWVHFPITDSLWGPGNSLSAGESAKANIVCEGAPHRIIDNHLHGVPIHNIYSEGSGSTLIAGNLMEQAQQENIHILCGDGGGSEGWHWRIINNGFQSNAIDIAPGEGNPGYGDPIPDTYDAVYLESQDDTSAVGPILIANNGFRTRYARYAVHVKKGRHIQIIGNMMSNEDIPSYMEDEPFFLEAGCSDVEINGNSPSNKFSGVGANYNRGSIVVPLGTTTYTVTHNLGRTPTSVMLTPMADHGGVRYWPANIGDTTFDVKFHTANGADDPFDWAAWVE